VKACAQRGVSNNATLFGNETEDLMELFCSDTEIEQDNSDTTSEALRVSPAQGKQAQDVIIRAGTADASIQMKAIDEAIGILYPYQPKSGQREALHHLIYQCKDLILIAGTGFGKSMILQAISVILPGSITIVLTKPATSN
jgi:hypothetical protein